ncbi:hypothetical protein GCK72_008807 [Caenorhabditis remanei]|uniref:BTB domain-containing protein n=2 Tax=Caenorhabditis remanei TaxID=31234 RepID=A0A6A5GYK0_CAERE|nr:hypothetical protein GCK72_008807 [Caenorhabditis remanei]KAF1760558.1 hypothetical protein GCK72_008807 [Caenorhabditis remanei]
MKFVLKHVFVNVPKLLNGEIIQIDSEQEEHFNVTWGMSLKKAGKTVCLCLSMTNPNDNDDYAIQTVLDVKTIASNGKMCTKTKEHVFKYWDNEDVGIELMSSGKMSKNYVIDGKLTIEARVKILEMSGIKKRKLRNFDETTKGYSDITLAVGEHKFYVSKLYLASHSKYFDSLLLGKFQESKKSEVVLRDIQPEDFQNFLEVLHGEDAISDETIKGILFLADMYDAPTAHRRCEQFLINESKMSLKEKLEISARYKMKRVKNKCLSKIKTIEDIRAVLPGNIEDMDHSLLATVLQKSLSYIDKLSKC